MNDAINATVQILCYESKGQPGSSVRIVNKTGYCVYYAYISPVSSGSWGSDRLGSGVLLNGRSITISSLPLSATSRYDIRLIDEDNDSYTKRNVSLSPNQNIEFSINDLDRKPGSGNGSVDSQQSVRITNNTGYTVYFSYVSRTSSNSWGQDVLGNDVLRSGQSVTVRLPSPLSVTNKSDIRLTDLEGDTYTKYNVTVTPNSAMEFTIRDMD
jgi:hypothetical protein